MELKVENIEGCDTGGDWTFELRKQDDSGFNTDKNWHGQAEG